MSKDHKEDLFFIHSYQKKRTIEELIQESSLNQSYYFMLIFSTIIVVAGIIRNQTPIIIAAMLIAPLLKPVLTFSLSLVTRNLRLLLRSLAIMLISFGVVILLGYAIGSYYPMGENISIINSLNFDSLYFIIALFAGMAATFTWTKQEVMSELFSGVAIAVTVLPPLAFVGISIASLDPKHTLLSAEIFGYNLGAITLGSIMVFVLSGFAVTKVEKKNIDKEIHKEIRKADQKSKQK